MSRSVTDLLAVLDEFEAPDQWDEIVANASQRVLRGQADAMQVPEPHPGSATVALLDSERTPTQPEGRHRWPIIAVAAALVAITVVGLVLVVGDDQTTKVPADQPAPTSVAQVTEESLQLWDPRVRESAALRIGFVGVPPVGARSSTPERGNLVLEIGPCTAHYFFDGLSVFADGRLIWAVSGRVLEQRLTPEGVELMRSELLGSGLLDESDDGECVAGAYDGHYEVGPGGRGSEFVGAIDDAHVARLANPWSWLPASAWADRDVKAFVPSEYSVSILNGSVGLLADLLPSVAQVADSKRWEAQSNAVYTDWTTFEVRTLAAALDAAGFVAEIGDDEATVDDDYLIYHSDDETSILEVHVRPRFPSEVGVGPIPG
jgi:hypothetical protein